MNPLISICIPTFNGAAYIAEALDSALLQTYNNLEIIVSDDASKDDTLKIIETYKDKTNIPIHVFHHQPKGIGANWNQCVKKAKGKYIKFLFQDDVLMPNCIKRMAHVLESNSTIGLVACKRTFIVDNEYKDASIEKWITRYKDLQLNLELKQMDNFELMTKSIFKSDLFMKLPFNKIGEPTTYLFSKDLLHKVGDFREDLKQVLDYEFCLRVLKYKDIAIINEPLVQFRIHGKQATIQNRGNDQNDYVMLDKLIYKEYFWDINLGLKKKYLKQYHPVIKFLLRLKRKYIG